MASGLSLVSMIEAEAANAKKKYRQVIVDIEEMLEIKLNETVIPLRLLDDLVRAADGLLNQCFTKARREGTFIALSMVP